MVSGVRVVGAWCALALLWAEVGGGSRRPRKYNAYRTKNKHSFAKQLVLSSERPSFFDFEIDPAVTPIVYAVSASVFLIGDHLECPSGTIPICPSKSCPWYTCRDIEQWKPCAAQRRLSDCGGAGMLCECDYAAGYFWDSDKSRCELCRSIVEEPLVECDGGRNLSCTDCKLDDCSIAWNTSEHCPVVTENCVPKYCHCDHEGGWFYSDVASGCITKEACLDRIDDTCLRINAEVHCKNNECNVTCETLETCKNNLSDALTCWRTPECVCSSRSVLLEIDGVFECYDESSCPPEPSGPCPKHAMLKCNLNECSQRTLNDIIENKEYKQCELEPATNEGTCTKGKPECVCDESYIFMDNSKSNCFSIEEELMKYKKCASPKVRTYVHCNNEICLVTTCEQPNIDDSRLCRWRSFENNLTSYRQQLLECTNKNLHCMCKDGGRYKMFHYGSKTCVLPSENDEC